MFLEESFQKDVDARFEVIKKLNKAMPPVVNIFCHCPECNGGIDFREEPYKTMLEEEMEKK